MIEGAYSTTHTRAAITHIRAAKLIHNLPRNVSNENVLSTVSWDPLDYITKERL